MLCLLTVARVSVIAGDCQDVNGSPVGHRLMSMQVTYLATSTLCVSVCKWGEYFNLWLWWFVPWHPDVVDDLNSYQNADEMLLYVCLITYCTEYLCACLPCHVLRMLSSLEFILL